MSLAELQDLVGDMVRDDSGQVTAEDTARAIAAATERYAADRPRTAVEEVATGGGGPWLDLPTGWEPDFSTLISLEHPVGRVPPAHLRHWQLYQAPDGTRIMLARRVPADDQVRVTYTARHAVDATRDTTPAGDREALASWAAALLLDQLAAWYAGGSDSTIQADRVDHGSKSADFAARARALRKRYLDHLGIDRRRNAAAGAMVDFDIASSLGQRPIVRRGR